MNQNNSLALILAAGQGTRMKSNIPKPLMEVNGHPMIFWLIDDFKRESKSNFYWKVLLISQGYL